MPTSPELSARDGVLAATVYRWFPGGREQLIDEGITWEIGRFLARLAASVAGASDLASRIERLRTAYSTQ